MLRAFMLLVAGVFALVAVTVGGLSAYVHFKPVEDRDIASSVAIGVDGSSLTSPGCPDRRGQRWRCVVDDQDGSGNSSTYRVVLRGDRQCWSATRTRRSHVNRRLKERANGCVGFWDKVHVFE